MSVVSGVVFTVCCGMKCCLRVTDLDDVSVCRVSFALCVVG